MKLYWVVDSPFSRSSLSAAASFQPSLKKYRAPELRPFCAAVESTAAFQTMEKIILENNGEVPPRW